MRQYIRIDYIQLFVVFNPILVFTSKWQWTYSLFNSLILYVKCPCEVNLIWNADISFTSSPLDYEFVLYHLSIVRKVFRATKSASNIFYIDIWKLFAWSMSYHKTVENNLKELSKRTVKVPTGIQDQRIIAKTNNCMPLYPFKDIHSARLRISFVHRVFVVTEEQTL